MEQEIATQVVGLGGSSDFSLWKLFLRADFVVKFVIILLIASSIFSWALIFDKFRLFKNINASTEDFEKKFWKAKSAESFNNNLPANSKDPATIIFKTAMNEVMRTKRQSSAVQSARVERILEIATDNEIKKIEKKFWKAKSAESFNNNLPANSKDPATIIFKTAMNEVMRTKRQSSAVQSARVERILEIATDNEIKKIEKNFTYLATVGSTAPFIGLFGTVWGIMNSFQSIAISRNTSLAIVAPGIAEALFATALGLLAAIPAVVAYNKFNSDSKRYISKIDNFSKRFLSII